MDPTLWQTLGQLVTVLSQLVAQLAALGVHWLLLIVWVAWWLLGVNWQRAWPALRSGGWAPVVLLTLVVALAWSRIQPVGCDCLGFTTIPNFWWQLGYMSMLVGLALFCGWLQGLLNWAPPEIDFEPPAHAPAGDHGHH